MRLRQPTVEIVQGATYSSGPTQCICNGVFIADLVRVRAVKSEFRIILFCNGSQNTNHRGRCIVIRAKVRIKQRSAIRSIGRSNRCELFGLRVARCEEVHTVTICTGNIKMVVKLPGNARALCSTKGTLGDIIRDLDGDGFDIDRERGPWDLECRVGREFELSDASRGIIIQLRD